jgi:hypothetical protein
MKEVGFFREMKIAGEERPSMRPYVDRMDAGIKPRVVAYLEAGHALVMAPGPADDGLNPDLTRVAPLGVLTDGEWAWPAELVYYVETYDLGLPADFVDHMSAQGWQVRDVDAATLARIAAGGGR